MSGLTKGLQNLYVYVWTLHLLKLVEISIFHFFQLFSPFGMQLVSFSFASSNWIVMQCVGGAALMLLKRTLHSAQNSETRAFHGRFHVGVL